MLLMLLEDGGLCTGVKIEVDTHRRNCLVDIHLPNGYHITLNTCVRGHGPSLLGMRSAFGLNARSLAKVIVLSLLFLFSATSESASKPFSSETSSFILEDSSNCQRVCATFNSRFDDYIFFGQSGTFDFWDDKQAELVPACRVEPSSAKELSYLLDIVIKNECHFAVKSGGHERTAGASNAGGGVTIDLIRLNSIHIADNRRSVTIGAGLRWEDVYQALEQEQLMVLGGRVADVGVGGLLLGGGISFFSNERGLACDSIISYELVLPNTTIVTVGKDSHPELYRALRGAGQMNFGVVTSFTLEAFYSTHRIWSGGRTVVGKDVDEMLRANHQMVVKDMEVDPHVAAMNNLACMSKDGTCVASIAAQHTAHDAHNHWPSSLKRHGEMETQLDISRMSIDSITNLTKRYSISTPGKQRTIYGTTSYRPSVELDQRISKILCEEILSDRDVPGFRHGLTMHPFSTKMIAHMRKNGGNAFSSLAAHEGPLIILNIVWQWDEKADDEIAYASYYQLISRIEMAAQEMELWHPYKYINYAEATQDIWDGYGDHANLKELQRELDPNGIFARDGLAGGAHKLQESSWMLDDAVQIAEAQPLYKSEL